MVESLPRLSEATIFSATDAQLFLKSLRGRKLANSRLVNYFAQAYTQSVKKE
jgi:hypothetical protein